MDSKLIKLPKTLLLKDYLLDEMSSCSSNGFNSFPRNQCCSSTVRFLIDIDLNHPKKHFIFNNPKPKFPVSAFQTLIATLKRLPPEKTTLKKILKKTVFWKRRSRFHDIGRWKSLHQLMNETSQSYHIPCTSVVTAAAIADSCKSSSELNLSFSEVKRNDDENVEVINDGEVPGDSTTSGDGGATSSSTEWAVSGEKEQLSPVCVLDCPFEDDEEVSSPFHHEGEGTTKKLMEKMKRFECLYQMEPLNLSKRFTLLVESDNDSTGSRSSTSSATLSYVTKEAEERVPDLLQILMDTSPLASLDIKADKLLIDFFREKILYKNLNDRNKYSFLEEAVVEAERWLRGQGIREAFLGWEVEKNRVAYMNEMERSGEWRCLDKEIGEMEMELEAVIFDALFEELVVDISSMRKFDRMCWCRVRGGV